MSDRCKQWLAETWSTVVMLYTSGHRGRCKHGAALLLLCIAVSLALSSLLSLSLHAMEISLNNVGLVAAVTVPLIAATLFFSRNARCISLIFLTSLSTKQCRNFLLAMGTVLLADSSTWNMFKNLLAVTNSITCNRKRALVSLKTTPISNYVKMIRHLNKMLSNLDIVWLKVDVTYTVTSDELEQKLDSIEAELRRKGKKMDAIFDLALSVGQKLTVGLGVALLLTLAVLFVRKYTHNSKYKNTFITSRFVRYDEQQKATGKPHLLPLNRQEARRYIYIPCAWPRLAECWLISVFFMPVGIHILLWAFLIGLDALVYWVIVIANGFLGALEPFYVPLKLYISSEHRIIFIPVSGVSATEDFSYSVTMFNKDCLPVPTLLLSNLAGPAAAISVSLVFLGLLSMKLLQLKLLVSEQFYVKIADDRVKHLHDKIVRRRAKKDAEAQESVQFQSQRKTMKFWFPVLDFFLRKDDPPTKLSKVQHLQTAC